MPNATDIYEAEMKQERDYESEIDALKEAESDARGYARDMERAYTQECEATTKLRAELAHRDVVYAAVDEILKTDSLMIESYRATFWKNLRALKAARTPKGD